MRILRVEGNPINQLLAMRLLENWGHCITLAANGQIANNLIAKEERFELAAVLGAIDRERL